MKLTRHRSVEATKVLSKKCPECGTLAGPSDSFCSDCGVQLLDAPPSGLCSGCSQPVDRRASFCPNCGAHLTPSWAAPEPHDVAESGSEDLEEESSTTSHRRRPIPYIVAGLITIALGVAAAWFFLLRPPDLTAFDAGMKAVSGIALEAHDELAQLEDASDLPRLSRQLRVARDALGEQSNPAITIESEQHSLALSSVLTAQTVLFDELIRLSELPSASIDRAEFRALPGLIGDYDSSVEQAIDLREVEGLEVVTFETHTLTRTLFDLAAYREEVLKQRQRIKKQNKARAEQLSGIQAFTGQLDGVIERYQLSRAELSNWIAETDAGRTWAEAYQVLDQQQQRRMELRHELAALNTPAEFTSTTSSLLSIMDRAVDALGAASRGMAEFQFDWSYWHYTETPGWRAFEDATDDISDELDMTLSEYGDIKSGLEKQLSTVKRLPPLPD